MSPSKQFKTFLITLSAIMIIVITCTALFSCSIIGDSSSSDSEESNNETTKAQNSTDTAPVIGNASDYMELELSEYIKLNKYTGLDIIVETKDADKGELVWEAILDGAEVLKYPEDKVLYYYEQTRQKYMDYAGNDTDQYEYILSQKGKTEEILMDDARQLVKEDLVYYYMVKEASIVLTDEEKQALFDKYVDYYVDNYKYSKEYVMANMSELIYDSMLYDKTMEYLILNNNFIYTYETSTVVGDTDSETTEK